MQSMLTFIYVLIMFVCKSGDRKGLRKILVKVPKIYVNLENPTEVAVKLELVQ